MTDPRLPSGADLHPSAPWNQPDHKLCIYCDSAEILNQEERIFDAEPDDDKAAKMYADWKDDNTHTCERCYIPE
jgi:hypothetical protein